MSMLRRERKSLFGPFKSVILLYTKDGINNNECSIQLEHILLVIITLGAISLTLERFIFTHRSFKFSNQKMAAGTGPVIPLAYISLHQCNKIQRRTATQNSYISLQVKIVSIYMH